MLCSVMELNALCLVPFNISGFSMNGQLMSEGGSGFQKIVLHVNANKHIEFNTSQITIKDGLVTESFQWADKDSDHTADG